MALPHRRERLGREIVREVSGILLHEMKDPRLGFVSVTRAEVAKDLSFVRVYVSVMGDRKAKHLSMQSLRRARGFVQHQLKDRIRLREFPEVNFILDESIDKTFEITRLLDEVSGKRPPGAEDGSASSEIEAGERSDRTDSSAIASEPAAGVPGGGAPRGSERSDPGGSSAVASATGAGGRPPSASGAQPPGKSSEPPARGRGPRETDREPPEKGGEEE